ncbi:hypothetical protein OEZ85_008341 [Tetradesmus obliquus]|uniref:Uncharacterized protein n=1 Tax=Tetradesmus obliquus TaxID=3088 RepID=A0ABY8TIK1_TETOB|nr:hypothetical protein OEZ85_008341 [Tetradesmus obliquus]
MQQLVPAAVAVGRGALVGWLRCVLDLLAGLALVDPGAVLNELSHKLADPSADHSSSLPLVMSGVARLLQRPGERHVLLPHLGYAAALAAQALDPARPSLRAAMAQPVTALVKELTSSFPQVACHSSSLQLAVGSSRPLGVRPKDAAAAAAAGVVAWSGYDPVAGFASSWTQRLASLGSSKPSSHLPHAYIAVPTAAAFRQLARAYSASGQQAARSYGGLQGAAHSLQQQQQQQQGSSGGGEMSRWQLKWTVERLIELHYQGRHCATMEVVL